MTDEKVPSGDRLPAEPTEPTEPPLEDDPGADVVDPENEEV